MIATKVFFYFQILNQFLLLIGRTARRAVSQLRGVNFTLGFRVDPDHRESSQAAVGLMEVVLELWASVEIQQQRSGHAGVREGSSHSALIHSPTTDGHAYWDSPGRPHPSKPTP